jgi:hypothetical protein
MSLHLSVVPLLVYLSLMFRDAIIMFALVLFVFQFGLVLYLVIGFKICFLAGMAAVLRHGILSCVDLSLLSPPRSSATKLIVEIWPPLGVKTVALWNLSGVYSFCVLIGAGCWGCNLGFNNSPRGESLSQF